MGMKIGAIYATDVSNSFYRALMPLHELERRGHETVAVEIQKGQPMRVAPLLGCDVVHIYRRTDSMVQKAVDELRARGVGIVWDNDDDPRLIPPEAPKYKTLGGFHAERDFQSQGKIVRRAHVVTATSAYLAERYAEAWDVEPVVIENYLVDHHFPRERSRPDDFVIGWVAAGEHRADSQRLDVTQMLRRVMERDQRIRVVSMGVQLKLDPERYTHHSWVPFAELPSHLQGFDIGIAPIAEIPFNLARSNVKVKEYAAAGVPWVASARGPYADLGSRCGGMVIADDQWEDTLVHLAGSRFKRSQLRRRAKAWGKSQHLRHHIQRWEAVFETAADAASRQVA
jgi:glycosyltransferase involved in cell wall biosynthesis